MKIGVFADVHANEAALEAVLAAMAKEKCSHYLFLGDLVGYGPDAEACVQRLRTLGPVAVRGNHDEWVASERTPNRVDDVILRNVAWTREQLSASALGYLYNLPRYRQWRGIGLVHATNASTRSWPFVRGERRLRANFAFQEEDICFHGHTHVQLVGIEDKESRSVSFVDLPPDKAVTIPRGCRAFINPGSVGQPRDGDPRAAFAICELRKRRIRFYRCEYDLEQTVSRMESAGLPENACVRLRYGR